MDENLIGESRHQVLRLAISFRSHAVKAHYLAQVALEQSAKALPNHQR